MNIQGDLQRLPQLANLTEVSTASEKTPAAQPSTEAQTAVSGDQAHLSPTASLVSQAIGQSDVRTEKIASVQAAIANGSYKVEASKVASRLIDFMQEIAE